MLENVDRQSALLLYLADELSSTERALLDQRLSADHSLASELEALRQTMDWFDSGMRRLDERPLHGQASAIRRIGLAMRSQVARQAATRPPEPVKAPGALRHSYWIYSSCAAAAAVVACLCWWGHLSARPSKISPIASELPMPPVVSPSFTETDKPADDSARDNPADPNPAEAPKSVASLESAEQQLAELAQNSNNPVPSIFDQTGGNE